MLTLEAPQYSIRGLTIFRDYSDPGQFYYLPTNQARVSDNGRGLEFVVYTERIDEVPNFSLSQDYAGAFLTLEVELGPSEEELAQVRSELQGQVGTAVRLAQVPFTDGNVHLYILSQSTSATAAGTTGFEVSIVGSTKPALFGRQTAVFSARLGGKAANTLYETLRSTRDPQAVITYDLEFLALRPAYNLEVEINFKKTFEYMRNRIGVNALAAAVDIDLLTQDLINEGSIKITEVDYTGEGTGSNTPIAGEGGILKLVRDLMSPTLFTTVPIPTPNFRALPDSATHALETEGGTSSFISIGGGSQERQPIRVEGDLVLTHTPIANGQRAGTAINVSLVVEPVEGVTVNEEEVKLHYRIKGKGDDYQAVRLHKGGRTSGEAQPSSAGTATPTETTAPTGTATPTETTAPTGTATPTETTTPTGTTTPTETTSPSSAEDSTYKGTIPSQASGETIEYNFEVKGTKGDDTIVKTLPAQNPQNRPLSFTVGTPQQSGVQLKVPMTDGPLLGYSLTQMSVTEQVTRTFTLNRTQAVRQHYYPAGALSQNSIGSEYDPSQQVTRVQLGEGPFRIIQIRAQARFDFAQYHIMAAKVHVAYPRTAGAEHNLEIALSSAQPSGQVQFFANDAGDQTYDYYVEFTYEPERLLGASGQVLRSALFAGQTGRHIEVDLDAHSPVIPVEVRAGQLNFTENIIKQVQVRVAPSKEAEGRTIILSAATDHDTVYVQPINPSQRVYYMQQTFFFKDDSTSVERIGMTDSQVIVNEPADLIYRMVPRLNDPYGLIEEVLLDATYTHSNGEHDQAVLHLKAASPQSEFAVLLDEHDRREWDATARFVMHNAEPVYGRPQHYTVGEPLVGLTQTNLRVVTAILLEDTTIFGGDLLAVKLSFGRDVSDATLPTSSLLFRQASPTTQSLVVPGVSAGEAVSIAVDILRRNQPPERRFAALSPSETTFCVML